MTWGYKCYKNVHTQLHWKLQHRSVQSWTGNLGMRESPTAAEIQRLLSAWLGPREIMLKLKSCFGYPTPEAKPSFLCGRNCCRLDPFSKELEGKLWGSFGVVAMWSSEGDGDTDPSQVVDEQTVRFKGQAGKKSLKNYTPFKVQTLRCLSLLRIWMRFVHWPDSAECLPGTDAEAALFDGILSNKPRTYVQMFLWCCTLYHHGYGQQHSKLTWCYMSAWPSFRTSPLDFDFDASSAKASVYDYEKLQAAQIVSPVLSFASKPKHVYIKGL